MLSMTVRDPGHGWTWGPADFHTTTTRPTPTTSVEGTRTSGSVEVRDAQTEELRADSARAVVQDGAFTDSLLIVRYEGPDIVPAALGGVYGRPGTYTLRIERPGYQLWDTAGVRVIADECGPITVHLLARLSPES